MTKQFLELFPGTLPLVEEKKEDPPPVTAVPEAASSAPEKAGPEAPPLLPKEVSEMKVRQAPPLPQARTAPPVPQKEERIPPPAIPAQETPRPGIPLEEKPAWKSEGFLSKLLRPLHKNTVCLSLEGSYVRVLSLRDREVVRWATLPVNPRYVRNGVIVNPLSWGEQLHSLLEKERIRVGDLYCSLSAVSVTREFRFPKLGGGKLSEIVDREARRVLSYSSETSMLRWQKLDSKGKSTRVFVMLVPREPVMKLVEGLSFAGLKPNFIELKPMSLIRATNAGDAIIVHGELNSLELSIVTAGEPRVLRSLYLGDVLLRKEDATMRLLDELARTLAFYNETYREESLDISVPLFLTGELAMGSPLATQIKALTGRVVAPLNINLVYPPPFPAPAYLVNVGLALKARS